MKITYNKYHPMSENNLQICSVCNNHNRVITLFMTYHRVCKKKNTTGATWRAGTAYLSGAPAFISGFSRVRVAQYLAFCVVLWRFLFVLLSFFLLVIVLSVFLRYTDSDYHFSNFSFFTTINSIQKMANRNDE